MVTCMHDNYNGDILLDKTGFFLVCWCASKSFFLVAPGQTSHNVVVSVLRINY